MKKALILSVAAIAVLSFSGCGNNDTKEQAAETKVEQKAEVKQENKAAEATKSEQKAAPKAEYSAKQTTEAVKEKATEAANAVKEKAKEAVEKTKEAANEVANKAKEVAKKATESAANAAAGATEAVKKAANAVTGGNEKGKALYAKCVSCHGANGKLKALGKSEIIAGQSAADLEKKMMEYKAGTRNVAGMGALMQGQVKDLSDEDIKALAEYISSLK